LPLEGRKQDKMSGVADKFFLTAKELTVMGIAAVAVIICFALAASFLDNMNNAYAQQEQQGSTSVEGLLGTINSSVIAISGLIATAMSIVTGVVAWLRARFGEKVISDDTNDWLQDLFEKIEKKDGDIRDIFRQLLEKSSEIDVVLGAVKNTNPELAKAMDAAKPKIEEEIKKVNVKIQHWQEEANKIYSVSPNTDPVNK
jgi:hypothetical protein